MTDDTATGDTETGEPATGTANGQASTDAYGQLVADYGGAPEGTLPARMGVEVLTATADRVVGTMPVEGNIQPYGLLHGGASCVLAETLGSTGAALHAGPDRVVLGIEINATHHRGATSGTITGVATPLHRGGSVATYEIVVSDERERRVCTARLTCMIRDR